MRTPHKCITCKHYEPYHCNLNDGYIGYIDCDKPTKCRAWRLSDDYKKGGKFYEKGKKENNVTIMCQCNNCEYCKSYPTKGNEFTRRTAYYCKHPDQKAIKQFFDEHKLIKMAGFIGFSKTDGGFPIKRTPKWCPIS